MGSSLNRVGALVLRIIWVTGIAAYADELRAQDFLGTPRFSLVEDLRIDPVKENLVNTQFVLVRSDGVLAVTQPRDYRVVFFDSAGRRLGTYGRAGRGPGEFQSGNLSSAGWLGDTLWFVHGPSRRLMFVDPGFQFVREMLVSNVRALGPDSATYPRMNLFDVNAVLPGGQVLVHRRVGDDEVVTRPRVAAGHHYLRLAEGNIIAQRVALFPDDSSRYALRFGPGGRSSAGGTFPFAAVGDHDVSADGRRLIAIRPIVRGPGANTFVVTAVNQNGQRLFERRYPFAPLAIPRGVIDSAYDAIYRGLPGEASALLKRQEARAPVYPPVRLMFVGMDHSIWIRLRETRPNEIPWLILDANGNPYGHLLIPSNMTLMEATLARVWTTVRDGDGLEAVVRFSVRRANPPAP